MSLKPCKFYVQGQEKPLSYEEFQQYLFDNYDTLVNVQKASGTPTEKVETPKPSKLKERAQRARDLAAKYREQAGGTLSVLPNGIATALEVYASILEAADSLSAAVKSFRETKEYKALSGDDKVVVDGVLSEDEKAEEEATEAEKETKNLEFTLEGIAGFETGDEKVSSVMDAINHATNLSEKEKQRINAAISQTYDTLTEDDMNRIGAAVVEHYGGLDKALKAAMDENSGMLPSVRMQIFTQGIKDAKERRANAKTEKEQDAISDEMIQYFDFVQKYGRDIGRAANRIKAIYALDNLAVVRATTKKAERLNKINAPEADNIAKGIVSIMESADDISEAVEEVVNDDISTLESRIKELEEQLKKVEATRDKAERKPTKRKPKFTDADLAAARKVLFGNLSANPFANPRTWGAFVTIAAYHLERGYYKFEDFYKKMRKEMNGEYEEYYADAYNSAKQSLIEEGVGTGEFTDEDVVRELAAKMYKESEFLREKIAKEKAKLDFEKKVREFGRLLSETNPNLLKNEPKTKLQKLEALATELDNYSSDTKYSEMLDEYKDITEEEKVDLKKERLIKSFTNQMKSDKNTGTSPRVSFEQRLKETAAQLDELNGTDSYTKAANDFLTQKEEEASEKKERSDKISKRNALLKEFNKRLYPEQKDNTGRKEAKTVNDIAKELDEEFGTDAYTKMAENANNVKEAIKKAEKNAAAREALRKRFERRIETGERQTKAERKELEDLAKELDALYGTNEYSQKAAYFNNLKTTEKEAKETKRQIKQFAELMKAKAPKENAKARKTKEDNLRELAQKLDARFNTNVYTKQVNAYMASLELEKGTASMVKEALIKAGFSKEVTNPKTGQKEQRVDWKAVVSDSKNIDETVDKITQALEQTLPPETARTIAAKVAIDLEKNIREKKKKAVENYVKAKNRSKTARISRMLKRNKTDIEKLIDIWKQGGLDEKAVKEILAEELGIVVINKEIEKTIEKKLNDIDKAPIGNERELLEEDLQAYIESLNLDGVSQAIFDRLRLRLFGMFTLIKNLSGITTAVNATTALFIKNQLPALLGKGGDKYFDDVVKIAARKSMAVMGDMLMNGGVDLGSAFSEVTGSKEGTPRIRHSEYTYRRKWYNKPLYLGSKNINLYNALYDREKYISRFMSASDAFSQLVLQEARAYDEMKHVLRKNNPTMSNSEASKKAFEMMYSEKFAEAENQAMKEFADRGVKIDFSDKGDRLRYKRRVFEIVQQKRAEDIQKASILFANIHTFKAHDVGIMTPFTLLARGVKTVLYGVANRVEAQSRKGSINNLESKAASRVANTIRFATELAFVKYMPFINGVANIMEKSFELTPYGIAKGAAQAGYVGLTGEGAEYNYSRAFATAYRGVMGTVLTLILASMADDEDKDGIPDLFGSGPSDPKLRAVASTTNPQNSIRINGHVIPLDYLGTIGLTMKMLGEHYDDKRYSEDLPKTTAESLAYVGGIALAAADNLYTESITNAVRQMKGQDPSKFVASSVSELATRAVVPFASFSRQGQVVFSPKATIPIGLAENMAKYSGIIAGWAVNRPNFDYRGREYEFGDKYPSSPDGLFKAFQKNMGNDKVDEFVKKYHPTMPFMRQSDYAVPLDALGAASQPISDEEFVDFKRDAAKKFNNLLEAYYARFSEDKEYALKNVSKETKLKVAKEAAKKLLEQEGVKVDLESKEYLKLLEERANEELKKQNKEKRVKEEISELLDVAEKAAMYNLVEKLHGTHVLGSEKDKSQYESLLEVLKK